MGALIIGAIIAAVVLLRDEPAPTPVQASVAEEMVIVLPSADGHVGGVVVERGGARTVLDTPYAAARTVGDALPVPARSSAEDVQQTFAAVLAALPARPVSFTLYFVSGRDAFTEDSQRAMTGVLEEVSRRPAPDVVVIGHTDRVGRDDANDALSLQRAERVKRELVERGVAPDRIQAVGRGERELLVPTADGVAEPRNRRVEINVR